MPARLLALWQVAPLIAFLCVDSTPVPAAARIDYRMYGQAAGLGSLDGTCMLQDRAGELLVCTERGVFAYDGRRFTNLGPQQGLRLGRLVYGLAQSTSGRIAVAYADGLRISSNAVEPGRTASSLTFQAVDPSIEPFYERSSQRLVAWRDGFAFLLGSLPVKVVLPEKGAPYLKPIAYSTAEKRMIAGGSALFSEQGHLWVARGQALCLADPGAVRCFLSSDPSTRPFWFALRADTDVFGQGSSTIIARSMSRVETINMKTGAVQVSRLPDQNTDDNDTLRNADFFLLPNGKLATQSLHGLLVRERDGWKPLSLGAGIPDGTIGSALTDRSGQLWLFITGRGLVRFLGFGRWDTLMVGSDLPKGLVWSSLLSSDGTLWVADDAGLLTLKPTNGRYDLDRVLPGSAYAIAEDHRGRIWSSYAAKGVRLLDSEGTGTIIPTAAVNAITITPNDTVWLATETGLVQLDTNGRLNDKSLSPDHTQIDAMVSDDRGGVLYLARGRLRHRSSDGADNPVDGLWPLGNFDPMCMVRAGDGNVWIGGGGGLYRLHLTGNQIDQVWKAPNLGDTGASVLAVAIDRRGWVWAADTSAVWVFNNHRWVSLSTEDGLISDDINQNGLDAAMDGSIWVSTTAGLSHLRDPSSVFSAPPLTLPSITATFDGQILHSDVRLPYSTDPLSIALGTFDYGSEQTIVFRYKLAGVDRDFSVSSSGAIRYPTIPPGKHVLSVIAYDNATGRVSSTSSLTLFMAAPWWEKWWARTAYAALLILAIYAVIRLRTRVYARRQHELELLVEERTSSMREAQVALRRIATTDGLTGLLNRTEAQHRLSAALRQRKAWSVLVVALVDIDHFKRVNDECGHLFGDEVLRVIGRKGLDTFREPEIACRFGGEEFLFVLHDEDGLAIARLEAFQNEVRAMQVSRHERTRRVTLSIGIARPEPGEGWEGVVGRADEALYLAKSGGRDTMVVLGAEEARSAATPAE